MRHSFLVIAMSAVVLSCGAIAAELELSRLGTYHEHALAVWGDGHWAVARGREIELWHTSHSTGAQRVLRGHSSDVVSLAASPDGRWLAAGERSGGVIVVWDLQSGQRQSWPHPLTGETVDRLTGHSYMVWSLAFSPDGKLLASGSSDASIRLWEVETGVEVGIIEDHLSLIRSVSFSPSGSILASSSCDGTVRLWDVHSLRPIRAPIRGGINVYVVTFSPDGAQLALVANPREDLPATVQVYETATWELQWAHVPGGRTSEYAASFSPDGTLLATGGFGRRIEVRNAKTGELLHTLSGHADHVWGIAFTADGERIISTAKDETMRVWRLGL